MLQRESPEKSQGTRERDTRAALIPQFQREKQCRPVGRSVDAPVFFLLPTEKYYAKERALDRAARAVLRRR